MWIRNRFDIGWRDLIAGMAYCILPANRTDTIVQARQAWGRREDFLITLSVRSAFDLALRSLQFPRGSEILLSALTVPDMVRIVESHGLVPVPVDTDEHGDLSLTSLRRSISKQSRMLVVAHLFGNITPLDEVLKIVNPHKLVVVEDCAQSFHHVGDAGHPGSDIVMHSFGPIKTATALGGAVVGVSSRELRNRMAANLELDPAQSRLSFAQRVARFAVLKVLSGRRASAMLQWCVRVLGHDFDSLVNSLGRSFVSSDILGQIRHQPSIPLLRLLRRRWQTYDFSRIRRRMDLGHRLDERIGLFHAPTHSYWVYPIFVRNPTEVRIQLRAAKFDATCQSRMTVVPAVDDSRIPESARLCWQHVLFLPWYPELPDAAVDEMAAIISNQLDDWRIWRSLPAAGIQVSTRPASV